MRTRNLLHSVTSLEFPFRDWSLRRSSGASRAGRLALRLDYKISLRGAPTTGGADDVQFSSGVRKCPANSLPTIWPAEGSYQLSVSSYIPKARIVCAFNTVPSEVLFSVFEARKKASKSSLVYGGDDESSKRIASGLIRDVGFDPVDAGPLRIARYAEPFALLIAQLAYEGEDGPELAYRFEQLRK